MATRYDVDRDGLAELVADEPSYRVQQVWEGLYGQAREPAEMTNLPKSLRARLDDLLPPALRSVREVEADDGATVKWLFELADGHRIETVLMHYDARSTVCVSSQAGCAMGCDFCATGQAGFDRNLGVGEIVEQVIRAQRAAGERRVSNVVFMGMGEPLANYDATLAAVRRLHEDLGLSARGITISTVGVAPGMRRLADEDLPVGLALSLHAANDTLRDELVPLNRRYPLAELAEAAQKYRRARNRRLTLEWALIADTNDRNRDIDELAGYARRLRAHVNLIPLNPTPGYPTVGSAPERVRAFCDGLREAGVNATVRRTRGREIDAACGQLRATAGEGRTSTVAPPVVRTASTRRSPTRT
jgi:23S rRNA (adenine2503-C2)-methyltransferase